MRIELSYAVALSVLFFVVINFGYVESDNSNCSHVGGKPEDCVNTEDCPVVTSLLNNKTNSVSNVTRHYLRSIHCGWSAGRTPMVCCPPDALGDKSLAAVDRPYKHRNLHLLAEQDCGQSLGDRIIGGKVADLYEFPWMVLLAYKTDARKVEYQCGGSLINKKYVLTAAHCVKSNLVGVRVGEHNTSSSPDCVTFLNEKHCAPPVQDFQIAEIIRHDYKRENFANDIALLRLKGTVDFTRRNAQAVCLPIYSTLQNIQLVGLNVTIAGWGLTGDSDTPSDVLRAVVVRTITNSECEEKYRQAGFLVDIFLTDHKFCSGLKGKDSCSGDSGGPLIHPGLYNDKPRYIQYGIVSYGSDECDANAPGVYTKLAKYLDWILDNMKP